MPSSPWSLARRARDAGRALRRHVGSLRAQPAAVALAGLVVSGLATGCVTWDADVYFPEDYEKSYHKVHACKKGAHPAGDYVITWINDLGKDAFNQGTTPLPEGTVLVKSQYSDERCTEQSRFTVMKKGAPDTAPDSGDWLWQLVGPNGSVGECCDGSNGCVSCHTPCKSNDWVCTKPES